jgi:hypothetical protein
MRSRELLGDIARYRAAVRIAEQGLGKLSREERSLRQGPLGHQRLSGLRVDRHPDGLEPDDFAIEF